MPLTTCVLARPKRGGFPNRSSLAIHNEQDEDFFILVILNHIHDLNLCVANWKVPNVWVVMNCNDFEFHRIKSFKSNPILPT